MTEYTQCKVCNETLGNESREVGFPFCHTHRKCQKCGDDLYPYEAKVILETYQKSLKGEKDYKTGTAEPDEPFNSEHLLMDIIHPACKVNDPTAMVTIRASEYKFLNLVRNLVMPEMDASVNLNGIRVTPHAQELIADMEYEKLARTLERMENVAKLIRIAISQDPDNRKKQIADKVKFEKLAKDEVTKTAPKEEPPSERDVAYKEFLVEFNMAVSQESKKTFSNWFKSVKGMASNGIPYDIAKQMASVALKKGLDK